MCLLSIQNPSIEHKKMLNIRRIFQINAKLRKFACTPFNPIHNNSSILTVFQARHVSKQFYRNQQLCGTTVSLSENSTLITKRCIQTPTTLLQEIRYKEYMKMTKEGLKVVDVRNPGEIKNSGGVSGSFQIPLDQLEQEFMLSPNEWKKKYKREKPTEGSPIMFMCASGVRSRAAVKIVQKLGYEHPYSYVGGYNMFKDKK